MSSLPPFSVPSAALRVFCVDDDPASQCNIIAALARPGWSVECACDGRDALKRLAVDENSFDLLVTVHRMPHLDGAQLVRALQLVGFSGPVIVLSPALEPAERAAYAGLGVVDVIGKPVDALQLRRAIEAALSAVNAGGPRP